MIHLIKGDLFTTKATVIAHGVNCRGAFGSGVAGQIAKRWPKVQESYLERYRLKGWKLGDVELVYSRSPLKHPIIANMATQDKFGYDGKLYADYNAIDICLDQVLYFADYCGYSVAMPKVGCGLAGADWNIVYGILQDLSCKYDRVAIEVYELNNRE
jgi:O-acetyl-ADP-ribose deacetylase (regulator of RNase III)